MHTIFHLKAKKFKVLLIKKLHLNLTGNCTFAQEFNKHIERE